MGAKRRPARRAVGLQANPEDLQWLRLLDITADAPVPSFNRSRLIALGLVEMKRERMVPSERGLRALGRGDRRRGPEQSD
jgi:hypothetical protein